MWDAGSTRVYSSRVVTIKLKEVYGIIIPKRYYENYSLVYSAYYRSKSTIGNEIISIIKNSLLSLIELSYN
jgi:hypothetical protein